MADPDRQMRGRGVVSHPDPEIRGGGGVPKKIFQPLGPQFGLKIRGRARAPRAPPLDAPLRSVIIFLKVTTALVFSVD